MAAGIVGDLLVVEGDVSLRVLMWISAVSVCIGFIVGVMVIQAPHVHTVHNNNTTSNPIDNVNDSSVSENGSADTINPISDISLTSPSTHGLLNLTPSTNTISDNSTTNNDNEVSSSAHLSVSDKLRLFKEQLVFLRLAFRSRTLTALVLYWVMGNAVFMVSVLLHLLHFVYVIPSDAIVHDYVILVFPLLISAKRFLYPKHLPHNFFPCSTSLIDSV